MQVKKKSQQRERSAAKEIGGRAHIGSGCLWFKKADLSNESILIEDKFTMNDFYNLSYTTLKTLEKHSNRVKKTPIFRFGFDNFKEDFVLVRSNCYNSYTPGAYSKRVIMGKSHKIHIHDIHCSQKCSKGIILLEYVFELYETSYIMMTWQDFLDNIKEFYI